MLGDKVIPRGTAWRNPITGIKYPANWIDLASPDERSAAGLVEVDDPVAPEPTLEEVQAQRIEAIKQQSAMALRQTDWRMLRALEQAMATVLPAEDKALADEREAIRMASDMAEAAVYEAESVSELKSIAAFEPMAIEGIKG